jgi:hypothetical protein
MIEDLKKIVQEQRILVISSKLFSYQDRIVERLINLGANIIWLDGRPDNSVFTKLIMRYFPSIYQKKLLDYYRKSIKTTFDKVLVISPERLSRNTLALIKELTCASQFILYMWDSFANKKMNKQIIQYFDKCLTFDPDDSKKLDIPFRPLFFLADRQGKEAHAEKIDLSFVGTGHSDRAKIIETIRKQCDELGLTCFFYLYLQSPLIYYFHKITNKGFRGINKHYFQYKPINYNEYMEIIDKSKVIIDIEHPKQKGLTMRTFEVLGKEKKLITTNKNIVEYDFYNNLNISVLNRNNPKISKDFLNKRYQPLPIQLYYKYSIDGWLEDIFATPPPPTNRHKRATPYNIPLVVYKYCA